MMVDTHCHVYKTEMENAEEIIRQAAEEDIHLIVNGTNPASNVEVLELADRYDNVHAAIGYLYPFACEVTDDDISLLDKQLASDCVVAVGEIGLDYYHTKDNRERQIELFERMLGLAEKHGLPVIVHCRKAMQDAFDILERHDVVGSMHCYQGSAEMAERFAKLGFRIGIGGPITHTNNRKMRKTVNNINVSHMLVETDSPYLTPEERRGEMNTPLNLKYVIRAMAGELNMPEDEVVKITAQNARELFRI